jgi:ABC-type transport system involved in multi-copper enzyme maturation permease subunit
MGKILAISINTVREAIRNRILYSILVFAIFMIGSSYLLAQMQFGDYAKIVSDVGMGSISFFGVMISVFLGVGLLNREIERRTIYLVITKPVSRSSFLLGKFFGLNLTLLANLLVMLLAFYLVIWFTFPDSSRFFSNTIYLKCFVLIIGECFILTGLAILFSTFSTVILSSIFCVGLYIIGHLLSDIKFLALKSESVMFKYVVNALYYILPNLEVFNNREAVAHSITYSWGLVGYGLLYSVLYTSILLLIAIVIFSRRDYK